MSADNEIRGSAGGRALRCEEARLLIMGFIDGELGPAETRRLEDHLAVCVACRREETAFRKLGEVTDEMVNEELPPLSVDDAWQTIYRRLERSTGWLLFSAGLILLLGFGAWQFLFEFLLDPEVPLIARLGAGGIVAGTIILLVSIGRESWTKYQSERYREVKQ